MSNNHTTPSSTTSSWKSPSAAQQAKYHLAPLPPDLEATEEEQHLLKLYDTIRTLERHAARRKEQQARQKLAAKEAEFQQKAQQQQSSSKTTTQTTNKKKTKKKKRNKPDRVDSSDDEEGDGYSGDDSEEEEEASRQARKAAKLEALREQVEEAKQASAAAEATKEKELRDQLLATNPTQNTLLGPAVIKKKKRDEGEEDGQPPKKKTLLTSMMKMNTPPHEFSERLGLKASWKGKVLFPTNPTEETKWTPPESAINPNEGAFLVELDNFDITKAQQGTGNNTIAVKFNAPAESKRFRYVSIHIFIIYCVHHIFQVMSCVVIFVFSSHPPHHHLMYDIPFLYLQYL